MPPELFYDDPEVRTSRECLRWLPDAAVAHVGATLAGLPVVVPLPCRHDGDDLYLLISQARSLREAFDGAVVAVSAPGIEPATGLDWTILAIGRAVPAEPDGVGATLFAGAPGYEVFRVVPRLVTARPTS